MKRFLLALIAVLASTLPASALFDQGNLICQTTSTAGTGTVDLGTACNNYVTFDTQITSGATTTYTIVSGNGKIETGTGVFTDGAPDTMTRSPLWSSDGAATALTLVGSSVVYVQWNTASYQGGENAFSVDTLTVTDEVYGVAWDGSLQVPTKNALYDKIESMAGGVSDGDYGDITVSGGGLVWDVDSNAVISGTTPLITIVGTDPGAVGPILKLQHDSATPAASDIASSLQTFAGADDEEVGRIDYRVLDGTTATEDGVWDVYTDVAGASVLQLTVGANSVLAGSHGTPLLYFGNTVTPRLQVVSGSNGSSLGIWRASADSGGPQIMLSKSRSATVDFTVVQSGDVTGEIVFGGADGNSHEGAANIFAVVDGTPGNTDMPGRMTFGTSPDGSASPSGRMSIGNAGGVNIGVGNSTTITAGRATLSLFDSAPGSGAGGLIRIGEDTDNGTNFLGLLAPAAVTTDQTCVLENDASFIPDSCVGDGSDGGGSLADADYGDITVSGSGLVWTIDADTVALGTDTTGNYVATVADGTGIDGTCSSEGCTYTPVFDGTELATVTWGAGAPITWTFDGGANDITLNISSSQIIWSANTANFDLQDQMTLRLFEEDAGGDEMIAFQAPATIAISRTCTFQDSAAPIPDSCVGNGVDDTGAAGTVTAVGTPVDNQVAVWTTAATVEGDTAFTFDTTSDALSITTSGVFTTGTIELGHATANTLSASSGVLSIEGVALLTATSADALFLTPAEGNAAYQPLDADLTSWAGVTRASGFDTFTATPTSANLRSLMTDELGTGVLVFLGAPADDQVPVGDSATATTWRTVADSDAATQKLQYDQATNTFSAGTDDDVPESGDFAGLTGGSGITITTGTIDFAPTELSTVTWGAGAFTTMTFDAGATDTAFEFATGTMTVDLGGTNETTLTATAFSPGVDAGSALGTTSLAWNDLFLDTGATINIESGDWLATHTTGILTVGTGDLRVTNAGTNTASVVTVGGTQTLTAKTLTSPAINGATIDSTSTLAIGATTETNIEAALDTLANVTSIGGDVTAGGDFTSTDDTFVGDDLSLTSTGALINIGAAADCVITHSADTLTLTGCTAVGFGAPTNYVATVADGTGIDGTASGAASTYTPTLDLTEITEGTGIDLLATTISLDFTEISSVTWGAGAFTTMVFDAGATDPTWTYGSNSVALTNAATFTVGGNAVITTATDDDVPEIGDLTVIDTSAELRTLLTDEIGTGVLVFLGTPADDQVPVGDSASATTWRTVADSDAATQKLQYDQATNTFSAGTDDDVPESTDFGGLTGGSGITITSGTIDFAPTEISSATWGAGAFTAFTFDAGGIDLSLSFATTNQMRLTQSDAGAFGPNFWIEANSGSATAGDSIGTVEFMGNDDAAADQSYGAFWVIVTDAAAASPDGKFVIASTVAGTTTAQLVLADGATVGGGSADSFAGSGNLAIDDSGEFRLYETEANGDNYFSLIAAASLAGDVTCTIDSSGKIPDSCVGDGVDSGGTLADLDYGDITVSSSGTVWTIDPDSVALTTDTTGNYVGSAADGTGIDGTAAGEGATYTPTLDLTEISESAGIDLAATTITFDATELGTVTWGATATVTWTFDVGATDFVQTYANPGTLTFSAGGTSPIVNVDDAGALRILEEDGGGSNYFELVGPATLGSNFTCTIDASTGRIPDSCIGDGTDGGGGAAISGTPANNQLAVWTDATTIEGDASLTFDTSTDSLSITTAGVLTTGTIELGAASDTTFARDAAGVASIEGKKIKIAGKQTLYIPAGAMFSQVTPAGCGTYYDSGSNDVTLSVCAFDTGATEERATFSIGMPKSWNQGTLTYQALWTNTAGLTTETVQWDVGCAAVSDGDTLNATMGTSITQSDTWIAQNTLHVTAESSAMTCSGTPAQSDFLFFRIQRDTSADNMTGDALLIGLRIFWTDTTANQD